jgi:hypothetical protein
MHELLVPSRRFLGHMLIFLDIEFSSERQARNIRMLSSLERPTNCHNISTQTTASKVVKHRRNTRENGST